MHELELSVLAIYSTLPKSSWNISVQFDGALLNRGVSLDLANWPVSILKAKSESEIGIFVENDCWVGGVKLAVEELESYSSFKHRWFHFELESRETLRKVEAELLVSYMKTDSNSSQQDFSDPRDVQIASLKAQLAEAQTSLLQYTEGLHSAGRKKVEKRVCRACVGRQRDEELLRKFYDLAKENDNMRRSLSNAWKENAQKDTEIKKLQEELALNVLSIEGTLNLSAIDIERNTFFKDSTIETGDTGSVDEYLQKFLRENPTKLKISKLGDGSYKVAGQKLSIKLHEGQLCAQVCGGTLSLADFLRVQSKMQSRRSRQLSEEPLQERAVNTFVPKLNLCSVQSTTSRDSHRRSMSTYKSPRVLTKAIEPVLRKTRSKAAPKKKAS
mmetsp:Transcript_26273/g.46977  ORF Transcript_26273/g.46977 Transcript_26273/m.46977 type:complete len:386 (-) Transcript_26273:5142-6299(-)